MKRLVEKISMAGAEFDLGDMIELSIMCERCGEPQQASGFYGDAGRRALNLGLPFKAVALLGRALELDASNIEARRCMIELKKKLV